MQAQASTDLSTASGSTRLGWALFGSRGGSGEGLFQAALSRALRPTSANTGGHSSGQPRTRSSAEALGAEATALAGRLEVCKSASPTIEELQDRIAALAAALQSDSGDSVSEQDVLLHGLQGTLKVLSRQLSAFQSGEDGVSSLTAQVEALTEAVEDRLASSGAGQGRSAKNATLLQQQAEQALAQLEQGIDAADLTSEQKAEMFSLLDALAASLANPAEGASSTALAAAKALKEQIGNASLSSASKTALERSAETLVAALGESSGAGSTSSLTPWEQFKNAVKSMGMPLTNVALSQENLPDLAAILEDSGFTSEQVDQVMAALSGKTASLDRVLAAVGSGPAESGAQYSLSEAGLPLLARLLQETGMDPAQVQAVLADLPQDGKISPQTLARLLAGTAKNNLKVQDLSGVDLSNVRDLLVEFGLDDSALKTLDAELAARGGRMSMERFLALLEALGRSSAGTSGRGETLASAVGGLTLRHSFKLEPYFNRVVTLIQALNQENSDTTTLSSRSALEVLQPDSSTLTATISQAVSEAETNLKVQAAEAVSGSTGDAGQTQETFRLGASGKTFSESTASAVMRQVSEWLTYSANNQRHNIRIQLDPPELGAVRIYLAYRDGNLKARFVAEHGFVKEALDQQASQLKQTLAQQGLNLERIEVMTEAEQEAASNGSENLADEHKGRGYRGEQAVSSGQAAEGEQEAGLRDTIIGLSGRSAGQVDLLA